MNKNTHEIAFTTSINSPLLARIMSQDGRQNTGTKVISVGWCPKISPWTPQSSGEKKRFQLQMDVWAWNPHAARESGGRSTRRSRQVLPDDRLDSLVGERGKSNKRRCRYRPHAARECKRRSTRSSRLVLLKSPPFSCSRIAIRFPLLGLESQYSCQMHTVIAVYVYFRK